MLWNTVNIHKVHTSFCTHSFDRICIFFYKKNNEKDMVYDDM